MHHSTSRGRRFVVAVTVSLLASGLPACKRHHHHHDGGMVAAPYGTYPGQPPGSYPGQPPGSYPGQVPGMIGTPGAGMSVVVPPPIATAPDNPGMPIPPPGVMRQLPQPQ